MKENIAAKFFNYTIKKSIKNIFFDKIQQNYLSIDYKIAPVLTIVEFKKQFINFWNPIQPIQNA